ncbi:MAG: hypothetical protein ACFB8W_08245 [Elainellaceae cyanobacterium]
MPKPNSNAVRVSAIAGLIGCVAEITPTCSIAARTLPECDRYSCQEAIAEYQLKVRSFAKNRIQESGARS